MTPVLIFIIIVLVVAALVIYAVQQIPMTQPLRGIIIALIALVAALVIIEKAGLLT